VRPLRRQASCGPRLRDRFGQRRRKPDGGRESRRAEGGIQRQHLQCDRLRCPTLASAAASRLWDTLKLGTDSTAPITVSPSRIFSAAATLRPVDSSASPAHARDRRGEEQREGRRRADRKGLLSIRRQVVQSQSSGLSAVPKSTRMCHRFGRSLNGQ
jgi:hypothetical protein